MSWGFRVRGIIFATVTIAIFLIPSLPQNENYHHFADPRAFGGIHNAFDVLSNVFFLIVGLLGMRFVLNDRSAAHPVQRFLDPRERWPYLIFFAGVALTAFGSAYYHLHPDDAHLVWDRLPMTLGFMSLLAATLNERISVKTGTRSLIPLLIFGVASVLYWNVTLARGYNDLRPYVVAQFGSLLALLLLVAFFPPRYTRGADLIVSLLIYALAKVFEAADRPIFNLGGIFSGHTMKHITAAVSAYWILRMLKLRAPVTPATS
jgi:succinate dehydrogenase hydrophobic anchor subunit